MGRTDSWKGDLLADLSIGKPKMNGTINMARCKRLRESLTFQCEMKYGPTDNPSAVTVIVKFRFHKDEHRDLQREAKAYQNQLADFQGAMVPRFYGHFRAKKQVDDCRLVCIVLEDCGDSIDQPLRTFPVFERFALSLIRHFH